MRLGDYCDGYQLDVFQKGTNGTRLGDYWDDEPIGRDWGTSGTLCHWRTIGTGGLGRISLGGLIGTGDQMDAIGGLLGRGSIDVIHVSRLVWSIKL